MINAVALRVHTMESVECAKDLLDSNRRRALGICLDGLKKESSDVFVKLARASAPARAR